MVKNASSLIEALKAATHSEHAATAFLEINRWPNGAVCPRCEGKRVYQMGSRSGDRNVNARWRCRDCAASRGLRPAMFTVRTGTVMEETRLPLRVWVFAFWKACASKKGISALQLSREMQINYRSALFVLRRLRFGLGNDQGALTGTVELDETYVGGKPRKGPEAKRGRGTSKTPVLGMVQRGGNVHFQVMERLTADKIGAVLVERADKSCRVITDEFPAYPKAVKNFKGGHFTVNHAAGEYAKKGTDINSNTVESVFSLIKRGVMGTFHSVSRKHLPNYLGEFEFRWNTRYVDDGERVSRAIRQVQGKRLEYRESVDNPPYLVG